MFDDVIQRQETPEIDGGIGEAPVADVGNLQLPVDALVGDPADSRAVLGADDGNGLFHGKFQVQEALNESRRRGVRRRGSRVRQCRQGTDPTGAVALSFPAG